MIWRVVQQASEWQRIGDKIEHKRRGAYGIRTRDLLNAIEALYQLS